MQTANAHPGMGAIVHDTGVSFRVWAPNAEAVFLTGTFNDWSENVAAMAPEESGMWYLDIPGAKPGDEYRFLIHNGDAVLSRIDPYARAVTSSVGNGIVVDPAQDWHGAEFEMAAWNEVVIYEMHVGTFHRPDEETAGTFGDAITKLGHLKRMGVNVVQIMPAMEFAGDISWGYNPAHIFAIESAYGGPEGFKAFIEAAHRSGIAVILDVVYNHFGPSDLDLWQFDGWSENDKGGIYFYNDWRSDTPWGDTRPDYGRSEVRQFIRDNALYWLEEYHLDGLRFDMTLYIRSVRGDEGDEGDALEEGWSLLQWVNAEITEHYPGRITIAEDLRNRAEITAGDRGWRRRLRCPVGLAVRASDPRGADRAARRGAAHGDGRPRAYASLQWRRVSPGDLHRIPRRGGERQGAHPARDRAGRSRRTWRRRNARRSAPR